MAYLHGLIFALCFFLFGAAAEAAPALPAGWYISGYSLHLDACNGTQSCAVGRMAWVYRGDNRTDPDSQPWYYLYGVVMVVPLCPGGQALNGDSTACVASITCIAPQVLNASGSGCTAPSLIELLNGSGAGLQYSGSPSLSACFQGSTVRGSGAACGGTPSPGSDNCTMFGPFKDTGVPCVGSGAVGSNGQPPVNTDPPLGTPSNCAAGLVPGQINGVGVCLKPSVGNTVQSSSSGGTSTTTNPDGSPGVTTSGGKQTTSDTTCTGSTCTTKTETTTQNPGGGSTSSVESKAESKDDFCTKNPKSPLCISSVFGGACASGFTCDGDAIQCALAREVHQQNCKLNQANAQSALFDVASLATGNMTTNLPGNQTLSIGPSSFDQSNALGVAASCIQDVSITVMSSHITLPFSRVCTILEQLGAVMLAVSFLLAARIVTRG